MMCYDYGNNGENKMKNRVFIVAPSEQNDEDTLHHICSTRHKGSLWDIYQLDRYEVIESTDNIRDAIRVAKSHGSKRPSII